MGHIPFDEGVTTGTEAPASSEAALLREPTPEMIEAGLAAYEEALGSYADFQLVSRVYSAMRTLECA